MSKRDLIGYASTPPNPHWPGNAKLAINFVINIEEGSEYTPLTGSEFAEKGLSEVPGGRHSKNQRDLAIESIYEYGSRSGFWRLVNVFDSNKVPFTFFACAIALLNNPKITEYIKNSKNDICCHGYKWEEHYKMKKNIERINIKKAYDLILKLTGK